MEKCPVEIFHIIFAFACTDDGTTGRSLALVSRWMYEASLPFQLQSLATKSTAQILALSAMLEQRAPLHRRVRFLALSRTPTPSPPSHIRDPPTPKTPVFPAHTETIHEAHPAHTTLLAAALERILRAAAPTLEVLTLNLPPSVRLPRALVPVPLPALRALHIACAQTRTHTPLPPPGAPHLPALRTLRIGVRVHGGAREAVGLLEDLPRSAPALRHFRVEGLALGVDRALCNALERSICPRETELDSEARACVAPFGTLCVALVLATPWVSFTPGDLSRRVYDQALRELGEVKRRSRREGQLVLISG